jgi:hypothetical protein
MSNKDIEIDIGSLNMKVIVKEMLRGEGREGCIGGCNSVHEYQVVGGE